MCFHHCNRINTTVHQQIPHRACSGRILQGVRCYEAAVIDHAITVHGWDVVHWLWLRLYVHTIKLLPCSNTRVNAYVAMVPANTKHHANFTACYLLLHRLLQVNSNLISSAASKWRRSILFCTKNLSLIEKTPNQLFHYGWKGQDPEAIPKLVISFEY